MTAEKGQTYCWSADYCRCNFASSASALLHDSDQSSASTSTLPGCTSASSSSAEPDQPSAEEAPLPSSSSSLKTSRLFSPSGSAHTSGCIFHMTISCTATFAVIRTEQAQIRQRHHQYSSVTRCISSKGQQSCLSNPQ